MKSAGKAALIALVGLALCLAGAVAGLLVAPTGTSSSKPAPASVPKEVVVEIEHTPTEAVVEPTPTPEPPTPTATRVLPRAAPTPQFDQADMDYVLCMYGEVLPDLELMIATMNLVTMAAEDVDIEGVVFWLGAWEEDIQTVRMGVLSCPAPKDELLLKARSDLLTALDEYTEAARHGKVGWQRLDMDEIERSITHMNRGIPLMQSATDALNAYNAKIR